MEFNNQYLTYEEYVELGGNLQEMPFNILEFKARKKIDEFTFNRLVNLKKQKQEVKMCVYELMNTINEQETKGKSSESIDGYSVSYANTSAREINNQYNNVIRTYLIDCKLEDGTPYMYCGVE